MTINYEKNGIRLAFATDDKNRLLLLHCSAKPYESTEKYYADFQTAEFRPVEIQISGENHDTGHGRKYVGTSEG